MHFLQQTIIFFCNLTYSQMMSIETSHYVYILYAEQSMCDHQILLDCHYLRLPKNDVRQDGFR